MRKIIFDYKDITADNSELNIESRNTSKRENSNIEGMYEYIDKIMKSQKGKMGLGVHAVRKEKIKDKSADEVLKEICENGLDINNGSSVLATVSSLGVSSEFKYHQRKALEDYKLGSEKAKNGVIALVPTILEGNDEQLYIGFPGMDISAVGNNHKKTCILDLLCCGDKDFGEFPKEFILGYFKEENGEKIFQKNEKHFFEMTDEEKGKFIKSLSERLTEQQKQISEAVIAGDIQKLEQLSLEMYGNKDGALGEDTVVQNAMLYLDRDRSQLEQNVDNQQNSTRRVKRKILLDVHQDVKLSDLKDAKDASREDIEEPEKNNIKENKIINIEEAKELLSDGNFAYYGHGTGRNVNDEETIKSIFKQGLRTKDNSLYWTSQEMGLGGDMAWEDFKSYLDNWQHLDSKNIILIRLPAQYINIYGNEPEGAEKLHAFYVQHEREDGKMQNYVNTKFIVGCYHSNTKEIQINPDFEMELSEQTLQDLQKGFEESEKMVEERLEREENSSPFVTNFNSNIEEDKEEIEDDENWIDWDENDVTEVVILPQDIGKATINTETQKKDIAQKQMQTDLQKIQENTKNR